jgi:hypothetical protein
MRTLWITAALLLSFAFCVESAVDYDPEVSRRMRSYSLIAHCTEQAIRDWRCPLCDQTEQLKDLQYIENNATSIMVFAGFMESIDRIIFVFRGTVDVKNWLEDFSFAQTTYRRCSGCKVHDGFYLSYLSVATQIQAAVKVLKGKYPSKEIVMTGASLGAALATFGAIEVHTQLEHVSELHTWGCPRVGNDAFAQFVKMRILTLRVVHNRDIVPHVPLVNQNYHHFSTEVLFDEPMRQYRLCDEGGEDPTCSNAYYPNYSVEDHVTYWVKLDVSAICG